MVESAQSASAMRPTRRALPVAATKESQRKRRGEKRIAGKKGAAKKESRRQKNDGDKRITATKEVKGGNDATRSAGESV